jgi:DNA helicase-2/ATP-dependent DNA helicase PcrA
MQQGLDFGQAPKKNILDGLNHEQKNAVTHKAGPLLIIAGAGTGKTSVITRRIAYIIEQKWAKPSEILALTFTEKAAAEMENRVDELVPYGFTDMWISTFHAFGDRLIRDWAIDLGLPANFKILTQTEQAIFIRQNLFAFDLKHLRPLANPTTHIRAMLTHFSRLKDELISSSEYKNYVSRIKNQESDDKELDIEKLEELANAYDRYQELMIQAGNLDFGDQLMLTYRLLKENKKVRTTCQNQFKYILVDEYQDTNFAQNEVVKLLASEHKNITVVGDDDQSIYRFRGASISNILDFKKSYPQAKEIVLTQNYRSTQEILDSSYKLIQHNNPDRLEYQNKIDKRLLSTKRGTAPELIHCDTLSSEADAVAKKIIGLSKEKKYKYNDFAILVRANSEAKPFIEAIGYKNIPHTFSGASNLFLQPEITILIAFIKVLINPNDNLSLHHLLTSDVYNIDPSDLALIYAQAKRSNRRIESLIGRDDKLLTDDFEHKLQAIFCELNEYRQKMKNLNAGELVYEFLTKSEYLKKLSRDPSVEDEIKIQNIAKFFNRISQFIASSQDKSLISFADNLEMILEVGDEVVTSDIDPDLDAVNILTVHGAKGLEWPVVFIINCVSDRFPSRSKRDPLPIPDELIKEKLPEGDFHLEEERRLFYVAATRAKDLLYLTSADDYGGKRAKKLSQFVIELLDNPEISKEKAKLSALEKIEKFKPADKIALLPKKMLEGRIRLSRQQIDDYFTCPKKYYYAHIIKIPLLENHQLMYGTAIHAALNHYFNRKIAGVKPTLNQLISDYNQAFRNVGFITREHEDQRKRAGVEALTRFFDIDSKSSDIPKSVENSFEFIDENVSVRGRYDLVYEAGESIEIRDFKTSDVREQKDADRRIKDSTQMMIYALAWYEKNKVIPATSLFFIESGLKGEKTFSKGDIDNTKNMILEVASGIKSNNFTAKPDHFSCQYCPYNTICPEAIN